MIEEGREGVVTEFCLGDVGARSLTKGRTLSKNNLEIEGSWLFV